MILSQKSDSELAEYCLQCISTHTENKSFFKDMSPSLSDLNECYISFTSALSICEHNSNPSYTSIKNQSRATLCAVMTWCAQSCNEIAGDDTDLLELSGFHPLKKKNSLNNVSSPYNIKLTQGPIDGSIYCAFKKVKEGLCYEIQFGNSMDDINSWSKMICTTSRNNMITDLPAEKSCYVRMRTIGECDAVSEWTEVVRCN